MAIKKNSLKEAAKRNTSISRKVGNEEPEVIKSGVPKEAATRMNDSYEKTSGVTSIGMSKGVTKNMDNYESLRVDVWLNYRLEPNEDLKKAYTAIEQVIDETLEEAVISTID